MTAPVLLWGCALACALQVPGDRFDAKQVTEDFAALERAVRTEWSYFEARTASGEVDFDALLKRARNGLEDGCTRAELAAALRELVAGLHDGHAGLQIAGIESEPPRRLPIELVECAEGIAVSRCWLPADDAKPQGAPERGDLVRSIDDRSIADALARAERTAFGSTPHTRRRLALDDVCRSHAEALELELEAPDGKRRRVRVATLAGDAGDPSPPRKGAPPRLEWPRAEVALLAIPSFALIEWERWLAASQAERDALLPEVQARFDTLLDDVVERKAKALIIDLRGNRGGTDSLGIHVAQRLLSKPFVYFQLSSKLDGKWTKPGGITYEPRRPFAGKVALLIDERTFSTASNFARCLRDLHPDLTVIGRPDGAGTGAPRRIVQLPHSMAEVTLCTHRVRGPAGAITEGNSTQPDVRVVWGREDLRERRDPDLAAALKLLD